MPVFTALLCHITIWYNARKHAAIKKKTNIKSSYNVVFMEICVVCLEYYGDIFSYGY